MHKRWALILAGWAFLLSGHSSLQAASIEINEQATHLELANGSALLTLTVINGTGAKRRAGVEIKFLAPNDEVKALARSPAAIPVGATSISIPVPFNLSGMKLSESKELPFYRIDYRLTPEDRGLLPSAGKVALGTIAPGVFALQMAGVELYGGGLHYRALVRAINP
ncbi:MAG TPA: hypothetical protein VEO19_00975 [Terriglobia bacterium]|nr:hypothetical protein [Terriglobia bacterium]